jgi:hypothetical protein
MRCRLPLPGRARRFRPYRRAWLVRLLNVCRPHCLLLMLPGSVRLLRARYHGQWFRLPGLLCVASHVHVFRVSVGRLQCGGWF